MQINGMRRPSASHSAMSVILAATDGSEEATRAVETAARLSKAWGAKLVIMTAAKELSADEMLEARRHSIEPGDLLERFSRDTLSEAKACAQRAGAAQVEVVECMGDAARAVADLAATERADMIVVGRRGRGRLAGLVLGSVSQKLAVSAPCPLVVVP
jgi:nucleotide-binding universal stress UspA family protein